MTAPYLWLTRRIGPDGLSLTAAGWLPPAVVREAMTELGWAKDWIGKANREDQTLPVLQLRESAQRLGLIRKIKGRLVLTSAAKRLLDDPAGLWLFLARSIAHRHRHDSERDATLLLLLEVAAGKRTGWADYLEAVAFGLGALGWRTRTGAELEPNTVQGLLVDAREVLLNLGIFDDRLGLEANTVKAPGQAFARAALHHNHSQPANHRPAATHLLAGQVEQLKQYSAGSEYAGSPTGRKGRQGSSYRRSGKVVYCPGPVGAGDGSANRPGAYVEVDLWHARGTVSLATSITPGCWLRSSCGSCAVVGDQSHACILPHSGDAGNGVRLGVKGLGNCHDGAVRCCQPEPKR
jgi:hypothetical protein